MLYDYNNHIKHKQKQIKTTKTTPKYIMKTNLK
jgi:hypothetical protein